MSLIFKMTSTLETVPECISRYLARRIYNRFQMILRLSKSEENTDEIYEGSNLEDKSDLANENIAKILDKSIEKAIDQFRKIRENGRDDITEKENAEIDK